MKEIKIEFIKRIGMISGVYIKLVSTKKYNTMLTNEIQILNNLLETRKQYVYEKNMRSKMIVVYAIEKEV